MSRTTLLWTAGVLAYGYAVGFVVGTLLLRGLLRLVDPSLREFVKPGLDFRDVGFWIGLCEHFMVVTFVLYNDLTAIGLIFAAKELVRSDKVKERPSYYLLGTLLNISMAIFFGATTRWLLRTVG